MDAIKTELVHDANAADPSPAISLHLETGRRRLGKAMVLVPNFDYPKRPAPRLDALWCLIAATPNLHWIAAIRDGQALSQSLPGDFGSGYSNLHFLRVVTGEEGARRVTVTEETKIPWIGTLLQSMSLIDAARKQSLPVLRKLAMDAPAGPVWIASEA